MRTENVLGSMGDTPAPDEFEGRSGDEVLKALAERVGGQAHTRMVYGDPVEREGITVIPVASVRWGFGMGSGFRSAPMRTGGGGAIASPVGYLEISGGRCHYVSLPGGARSSGLGGAVASLVAGRLARRRRRG